MGQAMTYQTTVTISHHVVLVHGRADVYGPEDPSAQDRAIDTAISTRAHVGVSGGVAALMLPTEWRPDVPVRVIVSAVEPADDLDAWDTVVDLDMDIEDGYLYLRGSGGLEGSRHAVPPGRYRVRWSARGYDSATREIGTEELRIEMWPAGPSPRGLRILKAWGGWGAKG